MSGNKKIIDDLKKYNKELDNFLPNVKFDYVDQLVSLNKGKAPDSFDEYFSLLGTNVIDLRTEVALLRKNLTNDIEAMVLREVDEAQKIFVNKVNEVNARAIMDMKSGLSEHMAELHGEVSDVKKEFSRLKDYNSNLKDLFMKFNTDMLDLKSDLLSMGKLLKGTVFDDLKKNIHSISQRMDSIDAQVMKKDKLLENNMFSFNRKLVGIESNLGTSQEQNGIGDDIIRINAEGSQNLNDDVLINTNFIEETPEYLTKVEKILDIDKKLKKLDSLR